MAFYDHACDFPARVIRLQTLHECIGHKTDVAVSKSRIDAEYLSIRLRIHQTWETIAGRAANALAGMTVLLVELNTQRDMERPQPLSLKVAEGRAMSNAAAHYKRVSQVGTQRRSMPLVR